MSNEFIVISVLDVILVICIISDLLYEKRFIQLEEHILLRLDKLLEYVRYDVKERYKKK